jgi:hypothetical protein
MGKTIGTVLCADVCAPLKTFDDADFFRQRRKGVLDLLYLFSRCVVLEFEQHHVPQHPGRLLTLLLTRNVKVSGLYADTSGAGYGYNNPAQYVSEHLQFPPFYSF